MSRAEGVWGEAQIANYLRRRRYELLAHSYHCRFGEIDLIARKGGVLCFVEVKTRSNLACGLPRVRHRRQAGAHPQDGGLLSDGKGLYCPVRFDVAEVYTDGAPYPPPPPSDINTSKTHFEVIHTIPYFDAHCDTIHRCHTAGTLFRDPELRAFYDATGNLCRSGRLRRSGKRAGGFARRTPSSLPCIRIPGWCRRAAPCRNRAFCSISGSFREWRRTDLVSPCRTGAEVDGRGAGQGGGAALSIEGAELLDCDIRRLDTAYDWGVRLLNPVWNYANVSQAPAR